MLGCLRVKPGIGRISGRFSGHLRLYSTVKVRSGCPLYLHDNGSTTSVSFSPQPSSVPMGSFPSDQSGYFLPAFNTPPPDFEFKELISKPDRFNENRQFWPIASQALKQHIHQCPIFSSLAAAETKTQFFHIFDLRSPPPIGRIPEVEDILGTVELRDGGIVPLSFEANAMYRPVTRFGAIVVSKEMAQRIAKAVEN